MIVRIVAWAVVILVVFFLVVNPNRGAVLESVWDGLQSAGTSLSVFINSL